MVECYWNLKTKECESDRFECNTLASQMMYRASSKGVSIGFHCQDNEVEKYLDKMKRNEIRDRKKEIVRLQKEIDHIKNMELPKDIQIKC